MTAYYQNTKLTTKRSRIRLLSTLLTVFCCVALIALGCNGRLRGHTRCCLLPNRQQDVEIAEKAVSAAHSPDLILTVDDRVANITLSHDSKRMILETRLENEKDDSSLDQSVASSYGVEIWNIEFGVARPEAFTSAMPYLVASELGSAAFDEEGGRVFWAGQEMRKIVASRTNALSTNAVVRGANFDENANANRNSSQPLYLARSPEELAPSEPKNPLHPLFLDDEINSSDAFPNASASLYVELQDYPDDNQPSVEQPEIINPKSDLNSGGSKTQPPFHSVRDVENVLLTKLFDANGLIMSSQALSKNVDLSAKRMKIADETRYADMVRLSPSARWIICETPTVGVSPYQLIQLSDGGKSRKTPQETEIEGEAEKESENNEGSAKIAESIPEPYDPNWALIPLRDRKRVVRFPETIKMTFDSSTSDEEIFGQIVDVLDVSDQGDLVATLVEEKEKRQKGVDTREMNVGANGSPRNKIVIWDLQVAKTVDFDKAKKPLRAIEVAQIAIPFPIDRRFCKFSPSGKMFAARVEPKCVSIWQSANGRHICELGDHTGVVRCFAFAPGETKIVVGTGSNSARVELWEIRKETLYRSLEDDAYDAKSIDAVAFSNDERYVYYANDVGEIKRWNTRPIHESE